MVVDREKIRAELKKAKERMGKIRWLPKDSTTHLRVLEFEDEDGSKIFARRRVEHRQTNVFSGKGFLCREETLGKPCAYCQVNRVSVELNEPKPYNYRTQYLMNGIDIDGDSSKVLIWGVPTTVFEDIAGTALDDEYENVLESKRGRGFTITKEGSGTDTTYGTRPMANPYPVTTSLMKQVKDPFEVIDDPGLEAQLEDLGMTQEDLFGDTIEEFEDGSEPKAEEKEETQASEPEENGGTRQATDEEEEPVCFGKTEFYDGDSDCKECPWYKACKAEIELHGGGAPEEKPKGKRGKSKAEKAAPKKRGRPKKADKQTTSSLASKIIGRSKKK